MNLRRANKLIVNRHQGELTPSKDPLPYQLRAILSQGFTEQEDCVFLTAMLSGCRTVSQNSFPDKTGYECFVNHIHIEDLVDTRPMPRYGPLAVPRAVQVAVNFLARVSVLLGKSIRAMHSEDRSAKKSTTLQSDSIVCVQVRNCWRTTWKDSPTVYVSMTCSPYGITDYSEGSQPNPGHQANG